MKPEVRKNLKNDGVKRQKVKNYAIETALAVAQMLGTRNIGPVQSPL